MGYQSGFRWVFMESDDGYLVAPRLDLLTSSGRRAATVFLEQGVSGHAWFVWDEDGVGGENSSEPTVEAAKITAESAVLRWGKHFKAKTKQDYMEDED